MTVWCLTLTYLDLNNLEESLRTFSETHTYPVEHILLDHHWPYNYWHHRHEVLRLAEKYNCKVMSNYKNVGGHQGYNWVLNNLPIADDDLFLTFDGDSFPMQQGWDTALVEAMSDQSYGMIALDLFNFTYRTYEWSYATTATGHQIKTPVKPFVFDALNIAVWRYSFLKRIGLFQAYWKWYGQIEIPMHEALIRNGLKYGYLVGYQEHYHKIPHDDAYQKWKVAHCEHGFTGTFEEWLRCMPQGASQP